MRQTLSTPSPLKKERRNKALSRFLWLIFVLIVLFVGLGLLSHLPKIMITDVSVAGTKVLDDAEVRQKTLEYLEGNVALFYARGNVFIYSRKKATEFIKREFPRVYAVKSIDRTGQRLDIDLEERQAAFTWCGSDAPAYPNRFEKKDCYFLDQTGFIFDQSPFFTAGVYLTFYGGINIDNPPIGQTIALKHSIVDFGDLARSLEELYLPIHSAVIHADGQNEFLLNLYTTTGDYARMLFNEDADLKDMEVKIKSAVGEESFAAEFEDRKEELEYIDTRFNNRVFYKFKEI